jgi:hypothetical protein
MGVPKITLDTNCIINVRDTKSQTATSVEQIQELLRASHQNALELAITTRVEADLYQDRDELRRAELLRALNEFPVIGGLLRWDTSRWDNGDLWAGEQEVKLAEEVERILFPGLKHDDKRYSNKINDVDHLVAHHINKRDIFVTDDKRLLTRSPELQRALGIVVICPQDCLEFIHRAGTPKVGLPVPPSTSDTHYLSQSLSGAVTFDYSNNDGGIAIGDGLWLFNTKWSKASDTSIHAYRNGQGIEAIALAKDIADINLQPNFDVYDFSSRVRSPCVGQTVVWRNVNGRYAITRVLVIKDDKRGAPADELTFAYQIFIG